MTRKFIVALSAVLALFAVSLAFGLNYSAPHAEIGTIKVDECEETFAFEAGSQNPGGELTFVADSAAN